MRKTGCSPAAAAASGLKVSPLRHEAGVSEGAHMCGAAEGASASVAADGGADVRAGILPKRAKVCYDTYRADRIFPADERHARRQQGRPQRCSFLISISPKGRPRHARTLPAAELPTRRILSRSLNMLRSRGRTRTLLTPKGSSSAVCIASASAAVAASDLAALRSAALGRHRLTSQVLAFARPDLLLNQVEVSLRRWLDVWTLQLLRPAHTRRRPFSLSPALDPTFSPETALHSATGSAWPPRSH